MLFIRCLELGDVLGLCGSVLGDVLGLCGSVLGDVLGLCGSVPGDVLGLCGSVPGVAAMCASFSAVELTFSWCHSRSTFRFY